MREAGTALHTLVTEWGTDEGGKDALLNALDAVKVCRFFTDAELLLLANSARQTCRSPLEAADAINALRRQDAENVANFITTTEGTGRQLLVKLAGFRGAAQTGQATSAAELPTPAARPEGANTRADWLRAVDDWTTDEDGKDALLNALGAVKACRFFTDAELLLLANSAKQTCRSQLEAADAINALRRQDARNTANQLESTGEAGSQLLRKLAGHRAANAGQAVRPNAVEAGRVAPQITTPRIGPRTAHTFNAQLLAGGYTRTSDLPKSMPGVAGYAYPQSAEQLVELSRADSTVEWATQASELVKRSKRLLQSAPQGLPRPISAQSPRLGDELRHWVGRGVSHGTKLRSHLEVSFGELTGSRQPWDAVNRSEDRGATIVGRVEQAQRQHIEGAAAGGSALGKSVQRLAASLEFTSTFELQVKVLELGVLEQRHALLEQRLRNSMAQFATAGAAGNAALEPALRDVIAHRENQLALTERLQRAPESSDLQRQIRQELRTAGQSADQAEAALRTRVEGERSRHPGAERRRNELMLKLVRAHGNQVDALRDLRLNLSRAENQAATLSAAEGRHLVGLQPQTVSNAPRDDWLRLEARLSQTWDRLRIAEPNESSERAVPKALQMQILTQALQATAPDWQAEGGASRAAGMAASLDALLRCSAAGMLPTPDDGPTKEDLGPVMCLLSAIPCGVEIACAMIQDVPANQRREYAENVAVFWRAENALESLEDSPNSAMDREFLLRAQQSARSRALAASTGADAEPEAAEARIAYHAVRNGLLAVAPGSKYREIDDALTAAADALKAQSALAPAPGAPQADPQEAPGGWRRMRPFQSARPAPAEGAGSTNAARRAPVNATTLQQLNTLLAAGGKSALPLDPIDERTPSQPLEALIRQSGPREKYFLSSKASKGFTLPAVQIPVVTGVPTVRLVPAAGLGRQTRTATALGFESPSWGYNIQSSNEKATVSSAGSTSIGAGFGLAGIARTFVSAGLKPYQATQSRTEATDIRSIRGKDPAGLWKTDEVNERAESLLRALKSSTSDGDGVRGPYDGALASVLLANDEVAVAHSVRTASSRVTSVGVGGGVSSRFGSDGIREEFRASLGVQIGKSWERRNEVRLEEGHTGVAARESTSQSVDRTTIGLFRGMAGIHSLAETETDRSARVPLVFAGASLDWSPADNATKVTATRFPIGEHLGGSLDWAESSPDRLIAELQTHTEAWLLRAMDVLPRPVGEEAAPTQAQKLQAAERMLERCVEALERSPRQTVQYGIKYELNPSLTGWIDGLEALRTLGLRTKNDDLCADAVRAASEVLHSHVAWMPKTVSARPAGSISASKQLNLQVYTTGRGDAVTANFSHINFPR